MEDVRDDDVGIAIAIDIRNRNGERVESTSEKCNSIRQGSAGPGLEQRNFTTGLRVLLRQYKKVRPAVSRDIQSGGISDECTISGIRTRQG